MKRLLVILAVLALVAAGCGGDDDDASDTTTTTGSASTTVTTVTPTTAASATVQVFFSSGDGTDCAAVEPVTREVTAPAVLTGAMEALLAGPTADEKARGLTSWFGPDTAGLLRSAEVVDGTARVDFEPFDAIIPNASTSCGSAMLLAQLDTTALQFPTVERTRYSFAGDAAAFYGWLQLSVPDEAAA